MRVKIYIEGGGDSKTLKINCREGFRKLLEKSGFSGRMPKTAACGGRNAAFDDFKTAFTQAGADDYPILLVDSEAPVTLPPWEHLKARDGWVRPGRAEDNQAHLMVQCMETWCLADRDALKDFFGHEFQESALPSDTVLESRSKADVLNALSHATRDCGRDRQYSKGRRSFELVGNLDPAKLKSRLPHFQRLLDVLDAKI